MIKQPATVGDHQDALGPKEWLHLLCVRLGVLVQEQWPNTVHRLQQLTGYSLPRLSVVAEHSPKMEQWDLDRPILMLSPNDPFTVRMAFEGILSLGSIGSGKSSGSLATFARAMLAHGFGMLILTSTPEEVEEWREWTTQAGREADFVVIEPYGEAPHQFNVLSYESQATSESGFLSENLVILMTEINSIVQGNRNQGGNDNQFFQEAMKELLRATVSALLLARQLVSLDNIRRMIATAPQSVEETQPDEDGNSRWIKSSYCARVLGDAIGNAANGTQQEQHDADMALRYWTVEYPRLHEKTRTSITATVTGNIDVMMYGIAYHMLATETTITPDAALKEGKILLLNVPVQQYFETGKVIAGIWKYAFQRAALRRDTSQFPHGVALVADEAHYHLSEYDATFQSVARRARVSSFYLSQNYSQIIDRMGGNESKAHSLLGNYVTKIFHSQSDAQTNHYASDLIGKRWDFVSNYSSSHHELNPGAQSSGGGSEQLIDKVLPSTFTTLRKGGPGSDFEVDALIYQGGRVFNSTNDTFMPIIFRQTI